jgi:dTDP-glucose pyrophosphorylase
VKDTKSAIVLCGGDTNLSDLPIVTNRSNAMIPVNGKPVIGWIIDDLLEKGFTELILVLRSDNRKLYKYVDWAFGNVVKIHYAFVQPGGTILQSLLAGVDGLPEHKGVHIVLGDTLIRDSVPDFCDYVFVGPFQNPKDWCLVELENGQWVTEYYDKQGEVCPGWLALAGVYSLSDCSLLRKVLSEQIFSGGREISHVLREYGKIHRIHAVTANEWYDFGHIHYFNLAKQRLLQSRYFNSLKIDPVRGTISKTSTRPEKLADELNWYNLLPDQLKIFCPRLERVESDNGVVITQEYYGYPNLAELYVFGDLALTVWMNALQRLLSIHGLFKNYEGAVDSTDVIDMYVDKTDRRIEELVRQRGWKEILEADSIKINGKTYSNYKKLQSVVVKEVERMAATCRGCIIHGDFCFSNILYDLSAQVVRLIDPRGKFGNLDLYGDPRYDMAKLRHSIAGRYDFILADLFRIAQNGGDDFSLEIVEPEDYKSIVTYFDSLLHEHGYDLKEIMLIEALLFVSMTPLHKDQPSRQKAMYLIGIMQLNDVLRNENSN